MSHETIRNDDFQVNMASVQMLEQIKSRKRLTDFARFFYSTVKYRHGRPESQEFNFRLMPLTRKFEADRYQLVSID